MTEIETETFDSRAEMQKALAKGGSGGGSQIWSVPKNSSMRVRFIDESTISWIKYHQYWDDEKKAILPKIVGEKIPSSVNLTERWLGWCLDMTDNPDEPRVIALAMPKTAAKVVENYWTMAESIDPTVPLSDRNYIIQRKGEGKSTEYSVMAEGPTPMDVSPYQDHMTGGEALMQDRERQLERYEAEHGTNDADEDWAVAETPAPTVPPAPVEVPDVEDPSKAAPAEAVSGPTTETTLFPGEAYRSDYTVDEFKVILENYPDDLEGIAADLYEMDIDVSKDPAGALSKVIEAQNGGDIPDTAPLPDPLPSTVRELRKLASSRGISPARMTKVEITEALLAS